MSSGAEYNFKKKIEETNKKLDPESRMSNSEISKLARKEAREYRDYSRNQMREEKKPLSAKEIADFKPGEMRKINRDSGTRFEEKKY
jgi:hypothetical protein